MTDVTAAGDQPTDMATAVAIKADIMLVLWRCFVRTNSAHHHHMHFVTIETSRTPPFTGPHSECSRLYMVGIATTGQAVAPR